MVIGLFLIASLGVTEEDWAVDALQVGMQRLDGAVAHRRRHNLVLDLGCNELLACACHLDKMDFEGAGRHIRYLVGEAAELGAV